MTVRLLKTLAAAICVVAMMTPAWATDLHQALRQKNIAEAEALIAAGADIEAKDEAQLTPLITAALAGDRDGVALLIEKGADPSGRNDKGFTALHAAAHKGHPEVVQLLIDHGLDVNDQENVSRLTPLHAAAERGFRDVATVLLAHGARLQVLTDTKLSPLFLAALKTDAPMVRLLRKHGADCAEIRSPRYRKICTNFGI